MTITIELPEGLAEQAAAAGMGTDEVNRFAIAGAMAGAVSAVTTAVTIATQGTGFASPFPADEEDSAEALAEIVAAGREALEDEKAGRLLTLEEANANLPQRVKDVLARQRERNAAVGISEGAPAGG